jgi:hypothetical protein
MSYADRIVPACQGLADALTAAGVPATLSRGALRVPGAWVRPDSTTAVNLAGDGRARVSVLLVAPQAGDAEALTDLCGLLDAALTVIDPDDDVDTSVVLPIGNNPLPAFRLVVDLEL